MKKKLTAFCPQYRRAIEILGRRWSGAIIRALLAGTTRFSELSAVIPGLSDRLLSERLKELEAEGIVTRTVEPETPVRIEYHLTAKGESLASVVSSVSAWANEWLAPQAARSRTTLARTSAKPAPAFAKPALTAGGRR